MGGQRGSRLLAAPKRAGHDRQRPERCKPLDETVGLLASQFVEAGIRVHVPATRRPSVADEVQPGHQALDPSSSHPSRMPDGAPGSMNHSVENIMWNCSSGIARNIPMSVTWLAWAASAARRCSV